MQCQCLRLDVEHAFTNGQVRHRLVAGQRKKVEPGGCQPAIAPAQLGEEWLFDAELNGVDRIEDALAMSW